eukprot:616959-Prymnesium_polylepis.1
MSLPRESGAARGEEQKVRAHPRCRGRPRGHRGDATAPLRGAHLRTALRLLCRQRNWSEGPSGSALSTSTPLHGHVLVERAWSPAVAYPREVGRAHEPFCVVAEQFPGHSLPRGGTLAAMSILCSIAWRRAAHTAVVLLVGV